MATRIRARDWRNTPLGALADWPQSLRTSVDTILGIPGPAVVWWGPAHVQIYNDAFVAVARERHLALLGQPAAIGWADVSTVVLDLLSTVMNGQALQLRDFASVIEGPAGPEERVFDANWSPLRDESGVVAGALQTLVETTERRRAEAGLRESEERQAFLLKLSDGLRPLVDPAEIEDMATRVLGEQLRATRVAYVRVTDDAYVIERDYVDGVASMAGRFSIDSFGPNKVADYRAGRTRIVRDTEQDVHNDAVAASNFAAAGVRAGIGVPLIKGERFVATLVVHMRHPRDWTPGEVALVEETAERTWAAIERAQAEATLRDSQARLTAAFESVPVGVAVIDVNGKVVIANEQYQRFLPTGLIPSRDPANVDRWRAWDAAGRPIEPRNFPSARALRGERVVPGQEMLHRGDDGREVWTRVASVPIHDASGATTGQASVISDIDVTKRITEALRESEERQAFLLALADRMRAETAAEAVIAVAADMLGTHFAASRIVFAEIDDAAGVARIRQGWTAAGAERHPPVLRLSDFGGALLDDLRAGRTVRYDDVGLPPHARSDMAALAAIGVRAGLSVPLLIGGRFVVSINVHQDRPRAWTDAEVALLEEAAERIWSAVERARAEAALRTSEERLRQFGDASQDILWIRDAATLQWTYLTPAFETIYGLGREEALSNDNYRRWRDLILPEDRATAVAAIDRVLAGERAVFEYRIRRPSDGSIRWLRDTDFPIMDDAGKVVSIGGVGQDMTDLKAIQAGIAASEERLRTLMEGIPQLVWRSSADGHWTWASPQWLDFTGQTQQESHGMGWLDAVHPDDRDATIDRWNGAAPHGMRDVEFRVRRAADGAWLWHHARSVSVRDADGAVLEWIGTTTDVHGLRDLQERQRVLVAELQHRTRNLITVVRSLADRTVGTAASLDDFKARFGRRLAALSRVQGLLSHLSAGERVHFDELLHSELAALGVMDGKAEQVTLEGPADVPLRSASVQTLALALHELATNAVKYGALSLDAAPDARLTVRWRVDQAAEPHLLHVDWRETGVTMPTVDAPARGGGYGRELIERALPYQLGADTTYELGDDGVRCTIEIPISREGGQMEGARG